MASGSEPGVPVSQASKWTRPVAKEGSSDVWKYFEIELPDKNKVRCTRCPTNTKFFKYSGSTRVMWYHLDREHRIKRPTAAKDSARQSQVEPATDITESATPSTGEDIILVSSDAPASSNVVTEATKETAGTLSQISIKESFARDAKFSTNFVFDDDY